MLFEILGNTTDPILERSGHVRGVEWTELNQASDEGKLDVSSRG